MSSYASVKSPLMGTAGKKMSIGERKMSPTHLTTMDHILQNPLAVASASISTVRISPLKRLQKPTKPGTPL
jgi:hypothetical protein